MRLAVKEVLKRKDLLLTALLVMLALATVALTMNRMGLIAPAPPRLDSQLERACSAIFPAAPQGAAKRVVFGKPLEVPDQSKFIPPAAARLLRLKEETESAVRACMIARELGLLAPGEGETTAAKARENVEAARELLKSFLKVDGRTACLLVSALGWPWTPEGLDDWMPDYDYAAFSERPEPIRKESFDYVEGVRRRLERTDRWMAEAERLKAEGMAPDKLDAVLAWSARLALASAFDSGRSMARAKLLLRKFFALAPFQADWLMGLWASQWTIQRGRFALAHLVKLYALRPETLALIEAVAARVDLDTQARNAVERLLTGDEKEKGRAAAELAALGPFSLNALMNPPGAPTPADHERLERIISEIRTEWPEKDMAGFMPAPRYECWARWLRRAASRL